MNIDKMKSQHIEIIENINTLREYSRSGIPQHANDIARTIINMSSIIKIHLSSEDKFLYPHAESVGSIELKNLSAKFKSEMTSIANEYEVFSRRWNTANKISSHENEFRQDANIILRKIHERMNKENKEFYPLMEKI